MKPTNFVLDVDGVMTDGGFYYTKSGLTFKKFGQYDSDALRRLRYLIGIEICFVTSDNKSNINSIRCDDIGFDCYVHDNSYLRYDWLCKNFDVNKTIYMGDSLSDYRAIKASCYGIVPNNSLSFVKIVADYVTTVNGGDGAVAEACMQIYAMFFKKETDDIIDLFTKPDW